MSFSGILFQHNCFPFWKKANKLSFPEKLWKLIKALHWLSFSCIELSHIFLRLLPFAESTSILEVCEINPIAITRISVSPEVHQVQTFPLLVWSSCKACSTTSVSSSSWSLDLHGMWCSPQKSSCKFHPQTRILFYIPKMRVIIMDVLSYIKSEIYKSIFVLPIWVEIPHISWQHCFPWFHQDLLWWDMFFSFTCFNDKIWLAVRN